MRVAVDTSALMMPVQAGVRLFEELDRTCSEYEAVVPQAVLDELATLSADGGEAGRAARVAADLAERCRPVAHGARYADDALVELVEVGEADAVVTNDAALRDRLLDGGVPVIHIRGRNKLTCTRP